MTGEGLLGLDSCSPTLNDLSLRIRTTEEKPKRDRIIPLCIRWVAPVGSISVFFPWLIPMSESVVQISEIYG